MNVHVEPTPPTWCLAQLKPNGLTSASRNLSRQGFEIFSPKQRITRRRNRQFREELAPLFPGYLFVETGRSASPWRKINSTLGVARLISFGTNQPSIVSPDLIAALRLRCDDDGILRNASDLARGDLVRIQRGPFADFVAQVETIDKTRRVWMLLDLMGRRTRVSARPDDVAVV